MNAAYPAGWLADATTPFHATDHDVPWVTLRLPAQETPPPSPTAQAATSLPAAPAPAPTPAQATAPPQDARSALLPVAAVLGAALLLLGAFVLVRRKR